MLAVLFILIFITRDALPLLPWFVIGAMGGLFSGWLERRGWPSDGVEFSLTFLERGLLACRILCFYAGKIIWPVHLMFHYPFAPASPIMGWHWLFAFGLLMAVAGLCLIARRNRGPLAAFLLFAGTLFPVLGFLNLSWFLFSYVADHFMYLACLMVVVPLAVGFELAMRKISVATARLPVRAAAGILLLIQSSLTWRQSQMYRDMETFYKETLARNPESTMGHYNYGIVLMKVPGRLSDALFEFDEALRLNPKDAVLQNAVGIIFAPVKNRQPDAIACFEAAVRLKPDYAEGHYNLAQVLENIPGRQSEAAAHYETALRIKPGFEQARDNLDRIRK